MKTRAGLIGVGALQVLILIVTFGLGSGHGAREVVDLPLAANTVFSILEADKLHFPLSWSRVTSFDVGVSDELLRTGAAGYLWLKHTDSRWEPAELRPSRPGEGQPCLVARVKAVTPVKRYTVRYQARGEVRTGTFVGNVRGNPKQGQQVLVTAEGGRVVGITLHKEFANKVYGKIVNVRKSNAGRYAYELTIRFPAGGRTAQATYTWNFYDPEQLPKPGQIVNLSFVQGRNGYRITYVDFNPFWPGEVLSVEEGYIVDLDFGLESIRLKAEALSQAKKIAETRGRLPLILRAELTATGNIHPLALLAGEEEIALQ